MIDPQLDGIAAGLRDLAQLAPGEYPLEPPLDEAELAAAEASLGVTLPRPYREFLLRVGRSGAGPDYGLTGPDGWTMPDELPSVTATVTTVDGETFTAGTGDRPGLDGTPRPGRPFPLTTAWQPGEALAIPAGAHLYDGCVQLNDIGCGYSSFLVVTGAQRGVVWVDYSAGDGPIAPVAGFLDWYQAWLDATLAAELVPLVRSALASGVVSPHHDRIARWSERVRYPADRVAAALYLGRRDEAHTVLADLERTDPSLVDDELVGWAYPEARDAALADPPDPALALASPNWRIHRALAENPGCPADALSTVAERAEARWCAEPDGRLPGLILLDAVARHPASDPDLLRRLAALPDRLADPLATTVTRVVAGHPALPADVLAAVATSPHPWVRAAAAGHPALPPASVAALAADPHPGVRAEVATRADAPLDALGRDVSTRVRAAVAANPAAPAHTLRRLGAEEAMDIAYRLARNPALPPDVRAVLAEHPDNPLPDPAFPDPVEEPTTLAGLLQAGATHHPDYPPALLGAAIADPDPMRGYGAGASPWLDADLLRALAAHPYSYARLRALDHPTTPADAVVTLADDEVAMVARAALARPETPVDLAVARAGHEDEERRWGAAEHPELPQAWLRRLADDPHPYVRRAVLRHPRTPADLVARLARDPDALVRASAGRRTDLDQSTVDELRRDPDERVARAARWAAKRGALSR